jgi:hypothetical protein
VDLLKTFGKSLRIMPFRPMTREIVGSYFDVRIGNECE